MSQSKGASSEKPRTTGDAVLELLEKFGPMVDHQLYKRYRIALEDGEPYPLASPQSVRTRRHELVIKGRVVEVGRGKSLYGRPSAMWAIARSGQRAKD